MIAYSTFTNTLAREPEQHYCDWNTFVDRLREMSNVKRVADKGIKRRQCPAVSPAIYDAGTTRANANVTGWGGWLGLDFDSGIAADTVLHSIAGLNHVLYSTTSCTAEKNKFRLILHLDRMIERKEIPALWCGAQHLFDATIDPACKDLARVYYQPAHWTPGDLNAAPKALFVACTDGSVLSVEDVIAAIPADVPVPTLTAPVAVIEAVEGRDWHDQLRLLKPTILNNYLATPKGGHHTALFRLMVACAYEALRNHLAIEPSDLVACTREADQQSFVKTSTTRWTGITAEATRALSYATASHDAAGGGTDLLGLDRFRHRANRNLRNFSGGTGW